MGYLILPNGEIREYDISKYGQTEIGVKQKLTESKLVKKIPKEVIDKLCQSLNKIEKYELERGERGAAFDAGSWSYVGYKKKLAGWTPIPLFVGGNTMRRSLDPIARQLTVSLDKLIGLGYALSDNEIAKREQQFIKERVADRLKKEKEKNEIIAGGYAPWN